MKSAIAKPIFAVFTAVAAAWLGVTLTVIVMMGNAIYQGDID